jgi:menaquinone-9 beta-reductase
MKVAIVGGGLAGLTCGIQLLSAGVAVHIYEKSQIPILKVCGEYLSLEVLPILESMEINIPVQNHPFIDRLTCSAGDSFLENQLELGGIGISRQLLDGECKKRFIESGGELYENTTVKSITDYTLQITTSPIMLTYDRVINASGRLNPFSDTPKATETYVGYKRQVPAADWPSDRIHLEFFDYGYFGCSKIENERVCICWLIQQSHLKRLRSIDKLEDSVHLKPGYLSTVFRQKGTSVAVSNFSFYAYPNILINAIGDAAGNIPPLVGNGMSLAITAGYQLAKSITEDRKISTHANNSRINAGIKLNSLSMSTLNRVGIRGLNLDTILMQNIISHTHGAPW